MVTKKGDIKDLFDEQIAIEKDMADTGKSRYHKKQRLNKESHNESLTVYGKALLKRSYEQFEKLIDHEFSNKRKGPKLIAHNILKDIDTKTLAVIVAKKIIDGISHKKKLTAFAISLAGVVEDELYFREYEKYNKALFKSVDEDLNKRSSHYGYRRQKQLTQSKRSGFEWNSWSTNDKAHIGTFLIELFIRATNFCEIHLVRKSIGKKFHNYKIIVPTNKVLDWLRKCDDFNELLFPEYLPTVIIPRKWEHGMSEGGGYLHQNLKNKIMLVTGHNITTHRNFLNDLKSAEMECVIDGLNAVQSTMYEINPGVLQVAETIYEYEEFNKGSPIVTKTELQLPNKPHDIATNKKSLSKWKADATIIYTLNQKLKSKRLQSAKILSIARKYYDDHNNTLGFPCNLDFRSRLYYVPGFLNPQGNDLAKGLLKFKEKKPIGADGFRWLCIHLANTYGEDKCSLDDREKWALDNKEMILNCSEAPHEDRSWIHADKPFQFLAACMEFSKVEQHGLGYESNLPIHIDGTNNGLQHFSAMFRDKQGGVATNLTDTDKPQDIYQIVADKVIEKLQNSNDPLAKQWLDFGIDRKATKRTVMVLPYGGKKFSCVKFIDEYYEDRIEKGEVPPFNDKTKACLFLANIVWDSMGNTVSKAKEAMDWLQSVSRLVTKLNAPVVWETPLGFPIRQAYYDTKDLVVRTKMMGRIRVRSTTDKINKRKQSNGISPNFIHGLDATAMYLTIDIARSMGIDNFAMVHDSYGTHACDVDKLGDATRAAFYELYGDHDPITMLRDQLVELLPESEHKKIPDLPERGELDIKEIKKSKYFFC